MRSRLKRLLDKDEGPNTGGMGAVASPPIATPDLIAQVEDTIVRPTLDGLKAEGISYKGFIFFGLMIQEGQPYVIEYNVRMGDLRLA